MKVGFLCNTNNYPLALAIAMRRQGADVVLIVDNSHPLHRPEHRLAPQDVPYGDWVLDLAPMGIWDAVFPTPKRRRVLSILRGCDAIVATSFGIGLAADLEKPLFAIAAGADLDVLANDAYLQRVWEEADDTFRGRVTTACKSLVLSRLIPRQKAGFRRAAGVEYTLPGLLPHGDALLESIGVLPERRHAFMLVDLEKVTKVPLPHNEPLRVLGIARLQWAKPFPPGFTVLDDKANDKLLLGAAEYRRRTGRDIDLRLPTKGQHLAETRTLAAELGLEPTITWLAETSQAEFLHEMAAADIIVDTLGEGTIGMAARDALALGRPLIANGKSEIFAAHLGEDLPVAQARSPAEVADMIERLECPEVRKELASRGRMFAERHFSADRAATTMLRVLSASAAVAR